MAVPDQIFTSDVWTLQLDTEEVQTTSTNRKIKYIDPSGSAGEFDDNITLAGSDKYLVREIAVSEMNIAGVWKVWSYSEISSKRKNGNPIEVKIWDEGAIAQH